MIAVITGDIIGSQKKNASSWMKVLKKELEKYGATPKKWEIFRGDSFQLEIKDPFEAFEAAIKIVAAVKSLKGLDVRMAIGVGVKNFSAAKITESNGPAFVLSGEKFEKLRKEKINLAISTHAEKFDQEMNLYFRLALIAINNWTVNSSQVVKLALEYPQLSQEELGRKLKIKQNAVSTRLKRANFDELKELNELFKNKLKEIF